VIALTMVRCCAACDKPTGAVVPNLSPWETESA
jgi:hypothetical protein